MRQQTITKFAIAALFVKVVIFLVTSISDDERFSTAADELYEPNDLYNEELLFKEDWTPELGEYLGLTQKEYRVKRRQFHWRRKQAGGSAVVDHNSLEYHKIDNGGAASVGNNYEGRRDDVNIPATMGYYNLSCPFEWYKYSCAFIEENEVDEQVTAAATQYYQEHLSEIWRAFDSAFNADINHPPQPKRIFMTGDSLLRQVFISVACNAYSLNAVEHSEVQWRDSWPCPAGLDKKCVIKGGQHSGFDAASIRFTNGIEMHFVPHRGFAYSDMSKGEPDVLQRMKWQVDNLGKIGFGTKTAFPPSGPMDVLVYNVGAHFRLMQSRRTLKYFVSGITKPLMKKERRPKIVYVLTPTSHFNTNDGMYSRWGRMTAEKSKCVQRMHHNPRAELERRILKSGVNVDVLLDYDDLKLGDLHVHKGDCLHYCMPGAIDLVAARLLESL